MELTVQTFLTLDGVMQAPGGRDEDPSDGFAHGGWQAPFEDPAVGEFVTELNAHASAFLFGRRTFEIFRGYWPDRTDPADPIATAINSLPKHVASTSLTETDATWRGAHAGTARLLTGDVVAAVRALKDGAGDELQVWGSGRLLQTLLQHGVVDRFRLVTYPVVLGSGRRLFGGGILPAALRPVELTVTDLGVVLGTYEPAGPVRHGEMSRHVAPRLPRRAARSRPKGLGHQAVGVRPRSGRRPRRSLTRPPPRRSLRPDRAIRSVVPGSGEAVVGDLVSRRRARRCVLLLVAFLAALVPLAPSGAEALTSATAVQGGRWDDPATWGGAVPPAVDAAVVIPAGVSVTIPADLTVALTGGTVQIDGFLFVGGSLGVERTDITNSAGGELWLIAGRFELRGAGSDRARLTNAGKLGNSGGQVWASPLSDIDNSGTIINDGPFIVGLGATVMNRGTVRNTSSININGVDSDSGPQRAQFRNQGGTLRNEGTIAVGGQLTNGGPTSAASIIENRGTIRVIGGTSAGLLRLTGTAPTMLDNHDLVRIENELVSDQSGSSQGLRNHSGATLALLTPWSSFYTGILQNDAGARIAIGNVAKLMNQAVIDNDGEILNANVLFNATLIRWRCNATLSGNDVQGAAPKDWCDHSPPDIEVPQSLIVEATGSDGATVEFITPVKDDKDPSPRVRCTPLASGDVFPLGSTTVTCTATDYVGNATSASFVVDVVDTLPATMKLWGEPIEVVVQNNQYVDEGATATDTVDGDISAAITTTGDVDTSTPGTYELVYTVEDSSGNVATLTRTVEVITPAEATANLIDVVDALDVPARHREELRRFLVRAEALLADTNASNDRGACELLVQFDESVDRKRTNGVLAAGDASTLLDGSAAIRTGAC